ncbi:cation diffusion facilitator family transporter [Sphingomonas hankyongi]|uniref:Cation diffusion facilitator family transporter n=1 Tax=Sphingomonas hankyongi TaxID=2908209 RepID=A0ABT0S1J3_9SPHN|nr:cation diffusion facilitator family transporter [Sphingomonas hankyongi]MCL6729712.1 cation diffusion facilitator family transporter [Sphingomonas hankyongi]
MGGFHSHASDDHGHAHDHDYGRAFAIGIALNLGFVAAETVFGFLANSMALLADAGHNLSDVLGLVVAWAGAVMAKRAASPRFTYGLKKAPILAALANALFLLVAVGAIGAEAVRRLFNPSVTEGGTVMIVAGIGIVINGATALLFAQGRHDDINIRGAYLHMAADAAVSAAVVLAGLMILWTGRQWIDAVMSLAVAAVILWSSIGLLKESVWMSLAGVPSGIDIDAVEAALSRLEGVETVHDLHVWPLSTTETALTAHLVAPDVASTDALVKAAQAMLHDRFHIEHCTLQIERTHLEDTTC